MLDITASVHSTKSPPVLSPDTPIGSGNRRDTDLPFVDGDGSHVIAMNNYLPIVFDKLPVTEYSQYPSDFIDDDFDEFDSSEKPLGSLSQSLVGEVD